ncbi:MAG TPA: hypothetical protein VFR15_13025, partial [Chloroflexia bacterium]|nr:hypothetical protein [Chloroflexia bacterium]
MLPTIALKRLRTAAPALAVAGALLLAGCGADQQSADVTPTADLLPTATVPVQEQPTAEAQGEPTMTTASGYPRTGHAPDYSWVAGRVTFTRIQSGCIYVYTDPAEIQAVESPPPTTTGGISGPIVGTAERSDTSPPLSEITPQVGPMPTQPPGTKILPGGPGWDPQQYKDGDYVVMFGRL